MNAQPGSPRLTVFFPCYNDAPTIRQLVLRADTIASRLVATYEILVVDDGSTDESIRRLHALEPEVPALRVIAHGGNRGYGGALRTGFREASGELVFYTDGDGQYDVRELKALLERFNGGDVDAVNGYKTRRQDVRHRVWAGSAYAWLMRRIFGFSIRDVDCDYRLIRRRFLDQIDLVFDSGAITVELVTRLEKAGCRFAEVPVGHYPRVFGRSEFFRLRPVLRTLLDVGMHWYRTRKEGRRLRRR
jgi:glycosyltransferase involved in cell wall biosynthesis